ncbi:MAG: FAD-dependent oxidoreductase [Bacteroides sp.]|nr:FAD-dependent oxidoreductase [Bacteroides sp.]
MTKAKLYILFLTGLFLFSNCKTVSQKEGDPIKADVIIYSGTSAAVSAAVQLSRMGKSVIIVTPGKHLGGLTAGGLGWTDTGKKNAIGGLSREFYHRIWKHYENQDAWKWQDKAEYGNRGQGTLAIDKNKRTMWIFEPHVAEQIFENFIAEYKIPVYRDEWLNRETGVEIIDGEIESITMLSGRQFKAKIFIDASYEGDLMASAGVSYHVGREANSVYQETWNGVQTGVLHHKHWFNADISPYRIPGDPSSGVLPRVSMENPGIKGEGDHRIQAYCFRLCMTNHSENMTPFPIPDNYDPSQYELLLRVFQSGWREQFEKFDPIPNKKTDTNNHGPFSSDNIGMNYDYPEASYERRRQIIEEHRTYQQGLLYFMCNDPRMPEDVRLAMSRWGLAKDEFVDNDNWPHQLYIREARRMIGEYVTTEHDITGTVDTPQPIGMGSYTMDSHNVQRYIKPDGFVQNEGDIGVAVKKSYKISLGSILPRREECTNLLVPVCVSSSHIAFGSIRMEPVFMILGQSAGTVAAMAIEKKIGIHDLSYDKVKTQLIEDSQVLELTASINQ